MMYFLAQDDSCHWYLVRADSRAVWDMWRGFSEDDPRAWVVPNCAKRLAVHPSRLEFELDPSDVEEACE
jgi:hypothetical protein